MEKGQITRIDKAVELFVDYISHTWFDRAKLLPMGRIIFAFLCVVGLAVLWLDKNNIFEEQRPVLVITESRAELRGTIPINNPENYCLVSAVTKEGDTVTAVCKKRILEGSTEPFKATLFPIEIDGGVIYKIKEF